MSKHGLGSSGLLRAKEVRKGAELQNRRQVSAPDTGKFPLYPRAGNCILDGMAVDQVQLRALAQAKADENWRFRSFLKGRCNSDEVDRKVFETTRRVWAGIDCTSCANCCRQVKPSFSENEVERLARRLGMEQQQFIKRYLEPTEAGSENPWQMSTQPCPFLNGDLCTVYEDRPADCSGYPYLYEPHFISRTVAMLERIPTCPIVYEVVEDLKKSLGFSRRRR